VTSRNADAPPNRSSNIPEHRPPDASGICRTQQRHADIIIPEGGFNEVAIEMIAARIRSLLAAKSSNAVLGVYNRGRMNDNLFSGGIGAQQRENSRDR
jgi:hypothetical protein